jgi:hypothetical protein
LTKIRFVRGPLARPARGGMSPSGRDQACGLRNAIS